MSLKAGTDLRYQGKHGSRADLTRLSRQPCQQPSEHD